MYLEVIEIVRRIQRPSTGAMPSTGCESTLPTRRLTHTVTT
jgi:hypothetical protein